MNKQIVTIKLIDELNVVVLGLSQEHIKYFYDKFGVYAKSYFFNPQYKLNRWDGKDRFFSKTGLTTIHFLPDIIPDLKEMGYKIQINDTRIPTKCILDKIDNTYLSSYGIELGDHQVKSINVLLENDGGIVVAGTGAGKSIIAACMVKLYQEKCNYNTLIIVPTKDLIQQMYDDMKAFDIDIGRFYSDEKETNHFNLVSTWQSLQNNPSLIEKYRCVIVDECHGAKGSVLKKLLLSHANKANIRIGLTGTLPKHESDRMAVKSVLGECLLETQASHLIDHGWLAKLNLTVYDLIEDLKDEWERECIADPSLPSRMTYSVFKNSYLPDYDSEKTYLQKNPHRMEFISECINAATELHGNSFILVNNINYGKKLTSKLNNAFFVYGNDDSDVRQTIFKLLSTNDNINIVTTFKLASTGLNIKRIFNLFLIDPGKSFITVIQSIGRGLRKADDKDSVNVYDIASDMKYSKKHLNERLKFYKEQNYKFKRIKIDYKNGL